MLSIKGNKSSLLGEKKITICISGSVAAVRVPELARELMRHGADVTMVASDAALELVGEPLLEWASENEVVTSLTGKIEHVKLGAYTDLVIVCPATANTISKIAMGIDDTPVTSTVTCAIGADKPVMVVPAMHESMYKHPMVADNLQRLDAVGVKLVYPTVTEGKAKLAENEELVEEAISLLALRDLKGKKIVITAGPTYEAIDAVRGITNLSSGKMGIELAKNASRRGAEVVLVYGPGVEKVPAGMHVVNVVSAREMLTEVAKAMRDADVLISAAAISDYEPLMAMDSKMPSDKNIDLELRATPKLVSEIRKLFPEKVIVGFKLEKENVVERAYAKLEQDGLDLVVGNHITAIGVEESEVYIVDREKKIGHFSGSKLKLAGFIIDSMKKVLVEEFSLQTEKSL